MQVMALCRKVHLTVMMTRFLIKIFNNIVVIIEKEWEKREK